ncbi:MAG: hypothetical protein KIG20_01750 [Eubacteriales bacterium]|nr:hypothetical protein [Eubacteriales bacterium]
MKRGIILTTVALFAATCICLVLTIKCSLDVFFSLTVTFATCFYHFAMRLLVGFAVSFSKRDRFNYTSRWFSEKPFEKKLYEFLKVKKWKSRVPTFLPYQFDIKNRTIEEIIIATCRAEVVHEIIVVLSFLPILASIWVGLWYVFLITSVLSALMDCTSVVLQRYNRPRLLRCMKRKQKSE